MLTENDMNTLEKITNDEYQNKERLLARARFIKLEVPRFSNVWLYDQGNNPTENHKDWLALNVLEYHKSILQDIKDRLEADRFELLPSPPRYSTISSRNAAVAIQTRFREYDISNLKVLLDIRVKREVINDLINIGCEIYLVDLRRKELGKMDILMLTKNPHGVDITNYAPAYRLFNRRGRRYESYDPHTFYPYLNLGIDILNKNPDLVFVPSGTTGLYANILETVRDLFEGLEIVGITSRFYGSKDIISKCNFIAATTSNSKSVAYDLYAPYRPLEASTLWMLEWLKRVHFCGPNSQIMEVDEIYFDRAKELANRQPFRFNTSYAGLAGLAGFLQIQETIPFIIPYDAKIIIVNTGRSKKLDYPRKLKIPHYLTSPPSA